MHNKKTRILKVYNQGQGDKWNVPTIILKGEWLRELGFDCNDKIEVYLDSGKLTIKNLEKNM